MVFLLKLNEQICLKNHSISLNHLTTIPFIPRRVLSKLTN